MTDSLETLLAAKAIVFDVDGTLVDTVDMHAEAWHRAFAEFGHDYDVQAIRSQIGKGGDQLMPVFLSKEQVDRQGKAIETFRGNLVKREYLPKVRGFPKVRELFDALQGRGKRIALGSSAKAEELEVYKKAACIDGVPEVETTSEDAEKSKPHPDIFQAALEQLKLTPDQVVVIGDTPYDVEAAKKAGVATIALLCGGFPERDLRAAGAVAVFRDPADLLGALETHALS